VAQLRRCSTVRGSVVVVDPRPEEVIHAGNRFMVYASLERLQWLMVASRGGCSAL